MRNRVATGMLLGTLLAVTGCGKSDPLAFNGQASIQAAELTPAGVQTTAERVEKVMLEVLQTAAPEGSSPLPAPAITPAPPTAPAPTTTASVTSRATAVQGAEPGSSGVIQRDAPVQRAMTNAQTRDGLHSAPSRVVSVPSRATTSPSQLTGAQLRSLQNEVISLESWGREMKQLPDSERRALERSWGEAEERLKVLAGRIIQSNPENADLFAPTLSELLRQVHSLAPSQE